MSIGGFKPERRDLEEERTRNWLRAYLQPLEGATIELIGLQHDGGELFTSLCVKLRDGQKRWVRLQADPEGNGPGWVSGLDPVDPTGARPKTLPDPLPEG